MEEQTKLAFQFAADLAKQLMTLSTGVIALTVTFTKDLVDRAPRHAIYLLRLSWALYLTSLIFGVWVLMALTGSLAPVKASTVPTGIGSNVRNPAMLQILTFLMASLFVIGFGISAVIKGKTSQDAAGTKTVPQENSAAGSTTSSSKI
jgi:hypothetical protein